VSSFAFGWLRAAWLTCLGLAIAGGCVPDYEFVPDPRPPIDEPDGGGPPPPSTPTACLTDEECADLAATKVCDSASKYCMECDPAREAELGRCGEGLVCDASGRCVLGCADDTDCLGLVCDTERGLCIGCDGDVQCTPGTSCSDAVCSPGCGRNADCPWGWLCCEGSCQNPLTDVFACGACGTVCEGLGECWNGVCGSGRCTPGTAECDGDAANGCETDTTGDPTNCGGCRVTCASNFCAGGACATMGCQEGYADCNQQESDQCETNLDTVEDCIMCGNSCSSINGEPSCTEDGCEIVCDEGFDDCDGELDTGCETEIAEDDEHCGDCDTVCENENGTTRCEDGECAPRCATGFDDCDGDPSNGCETDLGSSLSNCGGCGELCRPENATGSCEDGVCKAACEDGFEDCDGAVENGCESDLLSPETCGDCSTRCSDTGGTAICNEDGSCDIECDEGRQDCVNGAIDGCETDINISVKNCGRCGEVCPDSVGDPECSGGVCGISSCAAPNRECDPENPTRCETNILTNEDHCGGCGELCRPNEATGVCTNGVCTIDSCTEGFADCDGEILNGCEITLGFKEHCRTCAEVCRNDHGNTACTEDGCEPDCANGWGDCDGNPDNGCETQLNSLFNCGACNSECTKEHATPSCESGSCQVADCADGWENCDNEASTRNGCETPLNTLTNCGGCNVACNLPHASESCGTGSCQLIACDANWGDCSTAQAGCETDLTTTSNCLGCGNSCGNTNATNVTCVTSGASAGCNYTCQTGFKACDGDRRNGCETSIRSNANCGDCGVTCSQPNATATCATGTCAVQSCNTTGGSANQGFLDCTSAPGCETSKGTTSACRNCTESCTNAHGTSTCSVTTGCGFTCSPAGQWDNCDGNANNGCETSLTSLTSCGTCNQACDIAGSSESCSTGSCVATSCSAGFEDCTAAAGCETQLGTASDCAACGNACQAVNGTNTCTGSPGSFNCSPSCSTGFKSCDGEPDNGCERNIRTLSDCGDCNVPCSLPHATASCGTGSCAVASCDTGYKDCGSGAGCETQLGTPQNCADCGNTCSNAHGPTQCSLSAGSYDCAPTCDAGWKSCDMNPDNGCERDIRTLTDCGDCGVTCNLPNATESCATGSCVLTGCSAGFENCTSAAGCETQLGTDANCAGCGNECVDLNASNSCAGSAGAYDCNPVCTAGWKSCDSNPDNGCERNIRTVTDCGDCGVVCAFDHASESCSTGTCTMGACDAGWDNCTSAPGCETQLGTDTNCAACGNACLNSHGTNKCGGTVGNYDCTPTCSSGFGNCDGNPDNGCEADLTTASACGSCGNVCGGATPDCVNTGGVYKCTSRITFVNDVDSGNTGTNINNPPALNFTHSLQTGTNRIVILALAIEDIQFTGLAGARPETVSYGGVNMTQSFSFTGDASNTQWARAQIFYYYLTDTGTLKLPASGNQTVIVDATPGNNDPFVLGAHLLQFNGVKQTDPLVSGTGLVIGATSGNVVATNTATVTIQGSVIYAISTGQYAGNTVTPAASFTQILNSGLVGHQTRAVAGYRGGFPTVLTPQGYTVGFTWQFANPAVMLPIVILPVQVP
jgi:hypothetical protein